EPCDVILYSDSQYLVRAFNDHWIEGWIKNGWKNSKKDPVKNRELWERLLEAAKTHSIEWNWVKGHAGHELNERCDTLATTAADGEELLDDIPADPADDGQITLAF
ncbi:MAG: ribonuclease HI, partial [Lachnospiraceae bacterium]|nr:ribonuclease HI [Lachnospiraceae bacterium]